MLLIVPGEGGRRSKGGRKEKRERDTDPDSGNMVIMRVMNAVGSTRWDTHMHRQTATGR